MKSLVYRLTDPPLMTTVSAVALTVPLGRVAQPAEIAGWRMGLGQEEPPPTSLERLRERGHEAVYERLDVGSGKEWHA